MEDKFQLPTIQFVAGETQNLVFQVYSRYNYPFHLDGCQLNFALMHASYRTAMPLINKLADIEVTTPGEEHHATVVLRSQDTLHLEGKFIYQLTIIDKVGDAEIPSQGIFYIVKNINKDFLGG